jgi:hypothetical protein
MLASGLLLSPAAARGGEAGAPGPDLSAPRDTMSPCACAASFRCWKVAMQIDAKLVGLHQEEVEKAMPNRFFHDTVTFTMRHPSSDGHFLIVKCLPNRRLCPDRRDVLEERLIKASILESLPMNLPEGALYDPTTFKISPAGEKAFSALKLCRKTLLDELAAVVMKSGE